MALLHHSPFSMNNFYLFVSFRVLVGGNMNSAMANMYINIMRYRITFMSFCYWIEPGLFVCFAVLKSRASWTCQVLLTLNHISCPELKFWSLWQTGNLAQQLRVYCSQVWFQACLWGHSELPVNSSSRESSAQIPLQVSVLKCTTSTYTHNLKK